MTSLPRSNIAEEARPSGEEWIYKLVERFDGINTSVSVRDIPDTDLSNAFGVLHNDGRLIIDYGSKLFGVSVVGTPLYEANFISRAGGADLLLFTTDTAYKWNSIAEEWVFIPTAVTTALTVAVVVNDTSITVTSTTSFLAGSWIGVLLDDGTEWQTQVVVVDSATELSVSVAAPSGAAITAVVNLAFVLNGTVDIQMDGDAFTAVDWFVVTNGVDAPLYYDGSTLQFIPNLPSTPFICKTVETFANVLCLGNVIESGTALPHRVRFCDTVDPTNWTTGIAGFFDLLQKVGDITAMKKLGQYMIVYKESSIIRVENVGSVDLTFDPVPVISNEGVGSPKSVVDIGDQHVFIGKRTIYLYTGGASADPIGQKIDDVLFSKSADINPKFRNVVFGVYIDELYEVWFYYPRGTSELPNTMLRMNLRNGGWIKRHFDKTFVNVGDFEFIGGLPWSALSGSWQEQEDTWLSYGAREGQGTYHLLAGDGSNQVHEIDFVEVSDSGTPIEYEVTTKTFYVSNKEYRFDRYEFSCKGSNIDFWYSLDNGASWVLLATVSPGASYQRQRIFEQLVGREIKFRWSGSGEGFGLEWFGFAYKIESLY